MAVRRLAQNQTAAFYDRQAAEFMREAVNWEKHANSVSSAVNKQKYLAKAQEHRQKAIDALESAKRAALRKSGANKRS